MAEGSTAVKLDAHGGWCIREGSRIPVGGLPELFTLKMCAHDAGLAVARGRSENPDPNRSAVSLLSDLWPIQCDRGNFKFVYLLLP